MTTFYIREASGFREARTIEIINGADALITARYRTGEPVLDCPNRTAQFLRVHLGQRDYEVFGLLHLNAQHRLITAEDLFRGSLTGAKVHLREVVKSVLSNGSASVIFYHNHPSGVTEPSEADICITQRLKIVLSLIEVKVLDHLIVGESILSFSEKGLIRA